MYLHNCTASASCCSVSATRIETAVSYSENCFVVTGKILLRIAGFLDIVHRLEFQILENITFRKMDVFPKRCFLLFRISDDGQSPETQ
jgi:hypothetical protein